MNKSKTKQSGFTIVELLIAFTIIGILMAIGMPAIKGIVTDGKVAPTGADINTVVSKIRSNFAGQGSYANLGSGAAATAIFANTARGLATTLTIGGAGATATVQHDIGATNSQITVAQSTITTAGDSFAVTIPTVNDSACPGLSTQVSRTAEIITVNGVNVKAVGGTYNGGTAQNACTAGDTNTFVFTFR